MTHKRTPLIDWVWRSVYLMWPLTYAILVYDDLTHHQTWAQRLMPIFTSDFISAILWPAIWAFWLVQTALHHSNALTRLFGF